METATRENTNQVRVCSRLGWQSPSSSTSSSSVAAVVGRRRSVVIGRGRSSSGVVGRASSGCATVSGIRVLPVAFLPTFAEGARRGLP
eukprot:10559814-Alexandrium_andersonii.AAC.1